MLSDALDKKQATQIARALYADIYSLGSQSATNNVDGYLFGTRKNDPNKPFLPGELFTVFIVKDSLDDLEQEDLELEARKSTWSNNQTITLRE